MRIKPEILLSNKKDITEKQILVTGADESYVRYVESYFVNYFKKKNYYIDTSESLQKSGGDLFSEKKILFFFKNFSFAKGVPEKETEEESVFLFSCYSNKKTTKFKSGFLNSKSKLLVECFALNRGVKEFVLKNFIQNHNLSLSSDVFWYILDNFENEYVLFNQQLETLYLYGLRIDSVDLVERLVSLENKVEINKLFFQIFKNNNLLLKIFNKNILSQGDSFIFLNSVKLYLKIISESNSKENALLKFPKYLFNEKEVFLRMQSSLTKNKLKKIYSNILKAEGLLRKNSSLYNMVGLRFLINTKNIITS